MPKISVEKKLIDEILTFLRNVPLFVPDGEEMENELFLDSSDFLSIQLEKVIELEKRIEEEEKK